jgi:formylglycine-generating enzyme required for sulfatase activity
VNCDDKYPETTPVGSYRANAFGLFDMAGNVGEWVEDCYHDTYSGAPTNGGAVETCMQKFHNARVMRGGGWISIPAWVRSASRDVKYRRFAPTALDFALAEPTKRSIAAICSS